MRSTLALPLILSLCWCPVVACGGDDAGSNEGEQAEVHVPKEPHEVACTDESVTRLTLFDQEPSDAEVINDPQEEGFLTEVDTTGGDISPTESFVYLKFTDEGLKQKEALLESIVKGVMKDYPRSTWRIDVQPQYRNMKQVIDRHPEIVDYAIEAIRRAGLTPVRGSIRGGTDGSRLSFMGLPCPNIFAGEHAFHSRLEWVSRQDMEKAAETIVHLAMIWEERA